MEFGLLDYGARHYDPTLARWMSIDPLGALYPSIGGHVYCLNAPMRYTDPTGMMAVEGPRDFERIGDGVGLSSDWATNTDPWLDWANDARRLTSDYRAAKRALRQLNRVLSGGSASLDDFLSVINAYLGSDYPVIRSGENLVNVGGGEMVKVAYVVLSSGPEVAGLFVFLAERTNVEFSLDTFKQDGTMFDVLSTSWENSNHLYMPERTTEVDISFFGFPADTWVRSMHNHGWSGASGDDREAARRLTDYAGHSIQFLIYQESTNTLFPYSY